MFTPDDSEIVFTTELDCPVQDETVCAIGELCYSKKPRTNLRRVTLETLQTGAVLEEDVVFNVTKNPSGDVALNRRITGFSVTDDGASILFTATPTVDQSGNILENASSRQRNDREVYRTRLDGKNTEQLTNDLSWQAESPRIAPYE